MQRFKLDLFPSTDSDDQTFYVGRVQAPVKIDFTNGAAFLVYTDMDYPELHIGPLTSPDLDNVFEYYDKRSKKNPRAKHGNMSIYLSKRYSLDREGNNRKFYVGKLKFDGVLDASNGLVFLAFIADEGDEELQIAAVDPNKVKKGRGEKHE